MMTMHKAHDQPGYYNNWNETDTLFTVIDVVERINPPLESSLCLFFLDLNSYN